MAKILVIEDMDSVVDLLRTLLDARDLRSPWLRMDRKRWKRFAAKSLIWSSRSDSARPGRPGGAPPYQTDPMTAHLPIIVLSGKDEERDKVIGLEIGADDYVTKPFQANELIARVKNRLRRSAPTDPARVLRVGSLEMELDRYQVTLRGKPIHLTSKEFSLLRALLMTNGRVLSRDALFESVWGASKDADLQSRTIDVHIRSLRNKLGAEGRRIFTVRNVGTGSILLFPSRRSAPAERIPDRFIADAETSSCTSWIDATGRPRLAPAGIIGAVHIAGRPFEGNDSSRTPTTTA